MEFIKAEEEIVLEKGIAKLDSYEVCDPPADLWKWEKLEKEEGTLV